MKEEKEGFGFFGEKKNSAEIPLYFFAGKERVKQRLRNRGQVVRFRKTRGRKLTLRVEELS